MTGDTLPSFACGEGVIEAPILAHDIDDTEGVDRFRPRLLVRKRMLQHQHDRVLWKLARLISTICIFRAGDQVVQMVGLSRIKAPLERDPGDRSRARSANTPALVDRVSPCR